MAEEKAQAAAQPAITMDVDQNIEALSKLVDALMEFAVSYGFQILGALVFLFIGLKVAGWAGRRVTGMVEGRGIDSPLARLIGNIVKIVAIVFLIIITLGNFGISIAPLIALAGAGAFGATMAIQGPLSNFGAGMAIIMSRPFEVGNTISVKGISGVVDDITLGATYLIGEDGEKITIPNKEIVGEVIVNSKEQRIVETRIAIGDAEDAGHAIDVLRQTLKDNGTVAGTPPPQVGIHDFTYGGVVIGLRYWVPSLSYFQSRYAANDQLRAALKDAGIALLPMAGAAVSAPSLTADMES